MSGSRVLLPLCVAVLAATGAAGCGPNHGEYRFEDRDDTKAVQARLPGCAGALQVARVRPVPRIMVDLEGDGRPEPVGLRENRVVLAPGTRRARVVRIPSSERDLGLIAHVEVRPDRLYVQTERTVWRIDAAARRSGRARLLQRLNLPATYDITDVDVLPGCAPDAEETVLVRATRLADMPECPYFGGDVYQPRQTSVWVWVAGRRTFVRSGRLPDLVLGCNS